MWSEAECGTDIQKRPRACETCGISRNAIDAHVTINLMMKTVSVSRKNLIAITIGFLFVFLTFSPPTNAQTKPAEQKGCVEFTNMPAGASKPTPTQEVKLSARKFILTRWDENKK